MTMLLYLFFNTYYRDGMILPPRKKNVDKPDKENKNKITKCNFERCNRKGVKTSLSRKEIKFLESEFVIPRNEKECSFYACPKHRDELLKTLNRMMEESNKGYA